MHEETEIMLEHFKFAHLPRKLQDISRPLCVLAEKMAKELPDHPEIRAGLRKLLEAKDCFVRAKVAADPVSKEFDKGSNRALDFLFHHEGIDIFARPDAQGRISHLVAHDPSGKAESVRYSSSVDKLMRRKEKDLVIKQLIERMKDKKITKIRLGKGARPQPKVTEGFEVK